MLDKKSWQVSKKSKPIKPAKALGKRGSWDKPAAPKGIRTPMKLSYPCESAR